MDIRGIFITGTDTGVGKTYVATALAGAFRSNGIDAGVMKPAETGCRSHKGELVPQDALRLIHAAGARDRLNLVNPYRFRKPLAPAVAAEIEKRRIDPAKIMTAYRLLVRRHDFMIVEGAGGIMVPLSRKYLYLDLAQAMKLPVLIVARPGLGTINHTLLTISALKQRKVHVAGIVINYALDQRPGPAERTSPSAIQDISRVAVLGTLTHGSRDVDRIIEHL